jgi:prophage antirepressor-like protein
MGWSRDDHLREVIRFEFNGKKVRVQLDERGEPWLVAADACRCLGHTNPTMAIRALTDDEKGLKEVETPERRQQLSTVDVRLPRRLAPTNTPGQPKNQSH